MAKSKAGTGAVQPAVELTWQQVMAWRIRRHHLDQRAPRTAMLDVIGEICGLQAQVMSSAELALWARVENLEPDAVDQALWSERSLIKTWAIRGTLHLLPASEWPVWQAALSTYRHYLRPVWFRHFDITPDELERLITAVAQALDGHTLTREELATEVAALTGSAKLGEKVRDGFGAALKPAAFRGFLCFAPSRGQNVTFTRPDQWLHGLRPEDPAIAMREVTRRYLAAYAPAIREDYARWWGSSPAEAAKQIAALGDDVAQVDVEGTRLWMLRGHIAEAADAKPPQSVRLLPAFDPYVLGASRDVASFLPGAFRDRVYRPQGWISPVLLVDGRMDGVWRHEQKGGRLAVEIEPFVDLPDWARRAAEAEAERLAVYLGDALDLTWRS